MLKHNTPGTRGASPVRSCALFLAANSTEPGGEVTLQVCNAASPLQMWKNDYSLIHHREVPLLLEGPGLVLADSLDGSVTTREPDWRHRDSWTTWTVFDSTGQLRSQRNPYFESFPAKCLSLCTDDSP